MDEYGNEKCCGIIPYFQKNSTHYFLIIKHKHGHRGFPKWHIEKGESELETAQREFNEETGITTIQVHEDQKFIETYPSEINGIKNQKTVIYFLGEIDTENHIHTGENEITDYKIGTFDELYTILTHETSKKIFKEAINILTI